MNTLVAQCGHVPRTSGKTGTAGEQDMARSVASWLARTQPAGWALKVIDADPPSTDSYRGHAFVAIHGDGNNDRLVHGASVGYRSGGRALGSAWKAAYAAQGWSGGWKPDNYTANLSGYYGTGKAALAGNTRAIVVEVGMMTNRSDRAWIDAHHEAIARSIWAAVAGEETAVQATHAAITIADLGDKTHRAALKALAVTWQDSIVETATQVLVHAALAKDADAFIAYAVKHGLSASSITVDGPSHATMVVRSKGLPAPIDIECAAQLALAHDRLARIIVLAKEGGTA